MHFADLAKKHYLLLREAFLSARHGPVVHRVTNLLTHAVTLLIARRPAGVHASRAREVYNV